LWCTHRARLLILGMKQQPMDGKVIKILEAIQLELSIIRHRLKHVMSAISEFSARQTAFNDRMDAAVTGLQGDVTSLKDQITALQNSTGTITKEDQALLDAIDARVSVIADKLDALDALTPPVPPVEPPPA
jgi:uncharacterized membrane protein YdfJ with MMPL/SSD domain